MKILLLFVAILAGCGQPSLTNSAQASEATTGEQLQLQIDALKSELAALKKDVAALKEAATGTAAVDRWLYDADGIKKFKVLDVYGSSAYVEIEPGIRASYSIWGIRDGTVSGPGSGTLIYYSLAACAGTPYVAATTYWFGYIVGDGSSYDKITKDTPYGSFSVGSYRHPANGICYTNSTTIDGFQLVLTEGASAFQLKTPLSIK